MGKQPHRRATYEELLAVPKNLVAEILGGELYTQPRPATAHIQATSTLGEELGPPFKRGKGGPGGWMILDEPELHQGGEGDVVVPDLAGWRRETLPELPDAAFIEVTPDWVCEALSPSTRALDRVVKMPLYAGFGVQHVWLIDPDAQILEVFRLDGATYRLVQSHAGDVAVRAEPFEAIELSLGALWLREIP